MFAALSIPLWALQFSGLSVTAYLAGPVWHAHEMLFGFALAVIVGFLFTAGRNWTNQPTPSGLAAGSARRALGRRPGAGADAVRLGSRGRERRVPVGGGRRARHSVHQGTQPPELLLRRAAGL